MYISLQQLRARVCFIWGESEEKNFNTSKNIFFLFAVKPVKKIVFIFLENIESHHVRLIIDMTNNLQCSTIVNLYSLLKGLFCIIIPFVRQIFDENKSGVINFEQLKRS